MWISNILWLGFNHQKTNKQIKHKQRKKQKQKQKKTTSSNKKTKQA